MTTDPAIGLGQIQAADPDFDVSTFLAQAGKSLFAVKSALQAKEPADMRDLVSDSVYDDLRSDIMSLDARGAVHNYDGLSISRTTVVAAEHSAFGDQITVQFQAAASQYMIGEAQDPDVIGAPPAMPFSEYWTFSRPPVSSQRLSRPECPICGAPVDIDTGRICRYCKTLLPPPRRQVGWTVVSVTPAAQNT